MDMNVLRTFIAVCEYGGFTAAGEKLGYSQSTVSSQIRQLESELDAVLFDRIRHNTTMTAQGSIVLSYARQMLVLDQKMNEALHSPKEIAGEVRLVMADSLCSRYFSDDYLRFHELYPKITLKITSAGTERMFEMLRKNEADIVFTLDEHIYDSEYIICGESMEKAHFVVSSNHPLAACAELRIEDIVNEECYLTEPGMSYRNLLDKALAARSVELCPMMEVGNPYQICALLRNCNAVSFLPDYVTEKYIRAGTLVRLQVTDFEIPVWNQILIHKNKWLSPAMHALIDFYKVCIMAGKEN